MMNPEECILLIDNFIGVGISIRITTLWHVVNGCSRIKNDSANQGSFQPELEDGSMLRKKRPPSRLFKTWGLKWVILAQ